MREFGSSLIRDLQPPAPRARPFPTGKALALDLDRQLVRACKGSGARDLLMGELLHAMTLGDRLLRVGAASLSDYAREHLGIAPRVARDSVRLAKGLMTRPVLARAVRQGDVSPRTALELLPVAKGDAEADWVERARTLSFQRLQQAMRKALGGAREAPEPLDLLDVDMSTSMNGRTLVDWALELAGLSSGFKTRGLQLQALCQEFLSGKDIPDVDGSVARHARLDEEARKMKEVLERVTNRWQALEKLPAEPVLAEPPQGPAPVDAFSLTAQLKTLVQERRTEDVQLGRLALAARKQRVWKTLGFQSFEHYCDERLGVCVRAVENHIALERRCQQLPALKAAYVSGSITYEKARAVARFARRRTEAQWLERAKALTVQDLRKVGEEEAKRRDGPAAAPVRICVAASVHDLFLSACLLIQTEAQRAVPAAVCLEIIAAHFLQVWLPVYLRLPAFRRRLLERDGCRCQVPGCSAWATDLHHIIFRSQGGPDEAWNLVALCERHHQLALHAGYIRVEGTAPHGLTWELGCRPGHLPLMRFLPVAIQAAAV